ncbi:DUF6090 family protein [Ekhidna sp.]|uniref:DUF6090 family protein n=1 Tax=Ekhidna sp. TaxID=2608089 RepID=UPI003297725E
MKKNRFTSYLLYALGEILLVVIGILIAVILNNRNNEFKLEKVEKLSLIRLAEDLKDDIRRYEFLDFRLEERINRCDSTLYLIEDQKSVADRLGIISIHQINFFLVEANTTTYDEMLNTGRLYSMNNKDLRAAIIRYYRDVNKWSTYIKQNNQQLRTMMTQPNFNDYWVIQEYIWGDKMVNIEKYPWVSNRYSRELKDIEALIQQAEDVFKSNKGNISYLKGEAETLLSQLNESE